MEQVKDIAQETGANAESLEIDSASLDRFHAEVRSLVEKLASVPEAAPPSPIEPTATGTESLATVTPITHAVERRAERQRRPSGVLAKASAITGALLLTGSLAAGALGGGSRDSSPEARGETPEDVTPLPDGSVSTESLESVGVEDGSTAEANLRLELASVIHFPDEDIAVGDDVDWTLNDIEERGDGAFGFETAKTQEDIHKLLNGDGDRSQAARDFVERHLRRDDLSQAEIDRAMSGEGYLPVQVLKPAVIEGTTYFDEETNHVKRANERNVEAGDVFWFFVDEDGHIHEDASIRADCRNPNIEVIRPRQPEEHVPGVETPPTTNEAPTTTTTRPGETTTTTVPDTTTTSVPETTTTVPETTTTVPETTTTTVPETTTTVPETTTTVPETTTTVPETTTTTVPETTTTVPETTTTTVPETTTTTTPETTTTTQPTTTTTTPPTTAPKPEPTYPEGENPSQTTVTVNPEVTTPPEPTTSTTTPETTTPPTTEQVETPTTTIPGIPVDVPTPDSDVVLPFSGLGLLAGAETSRRDSVLRRMFSRSNWKRAIQTIREQNS